MNLRDELDDVREKYGRITRRSFVDYARPTDSPSHGRFEWDDAVAGERYRLQQAGQLIASVKITYKDATEDSGPERVRAFHAVSGPHGHSYEPAEEVAADPVLTEIVLRDMRREWEALRRRYAHFSEFVTMIHASLSGEDQIAS